MAALRLLLNRLLRDQRGFSIIETTTAGLLIIVGVLGTFMALDAGARTTLDAQRTEQAAAVAQREVERLKAQPYDQLGMATMPTPSTGDVRDPNRWVEGTKLVLAERYRDAASTGVGPAEELVNVGTVTPGPDAFDSGGTRGTIHRYVTWRDDACAAAGCAGAQDQKRITVAVVLETGAGGFAPKPTWVSTVVVDPEAVPPGEQVAPSASVGSGTPVTAQAFYLYDTPCSKLERQAPADHPTRATATDTCTGDQVPDLMGPAAPPGSTTDGTILPRYNFSSDVTRTAAGADGAAGPYGAALRRHSATDCFASSTDPTVLHRWATPAFKAPFSTPTTEAETRTGFSLVSRTLTGLSGAVTVCVRLHATNDPTKTLAAGTYTPPASAPWPTEPEPVAFVLQNHQPFTIPEGHRLVLTLSLTSTSEQDVELRYDHPDDRTFISVATTTPLS